MRIANVRAVNLPYITQGPGIGGVLRALPEDFIVEEIPAYLPSGAGDHVMFRMRKRNLPTLEAIGRLARALHVSPRDMGHAGLKDKVAVTTQWLSAPPPCSPEQVQALDLADIEILEVARHGNKLRTGHLHGNQFAITVTGVSGEASLADAERLAAAIRHGVPNWYGEQRFGREGQTAQQGRSLLLGHTAFDPKRHKQMKFQLSALQSELFNDWLEARLADGLLTTALVGDIMHKRTGGMFTCEAADAEQPRLAAHELSVTGPMFGVEMRAPPVDSPAAEREQAVLVRQGLTLAQFAPHRRLAPGSRRDAVIWPENLTVAPAPRGLVVSFRLPAGAYATVVMREFMKVAMASAPESAVELDAASAEAPPLDA